jgi:hypothetical protein
MRALAVGAGLLALAAPALAGTAGGTTLRVTYWEDSAVPAESWTWTLRCNPAGGTLPRPGRACARLAAGGVKLFVPVSPRAICTQIYGGPQLAKVVGTVNGRRVRATFTRSNGCEIARWQRISPWLVPAGGVR